MDRGAKTTTIGCRARSTKVAIRLVGPSWSVPNAEICLRVLIIGMAAGASRPRDPPSSPNQSVSRTEAQCSSSAEELSPMPRSTRGRC